MTRIQEGNLVEDIKTIEVLLAAILPQLKEINLYTKEFVNKMKRLKLKEEDVNKLLENVNNPEATEAFNIITEMVEGVKD